MAFKASATTDKIIVDRTKRRSASSQAVKDLRYRLTSSTGEPIAFEREMVISFAENHVNAIYALPVFVFIVSSIIGYWAGWMNGAYWFVVTSMSYLLLAQLCRRFLAEVHSEDTDIDVWRKTFFWAQLIIAASWGALATLNCVTCVGMTYQIILFSTILVFQAVTMMLAYGIGRSVLATSAPPSVIMAAKFAYTQEPAMLAMAAIMIVSQVFFYLIADRFKLSVISILEHKAERETLIAELETARSMSEEARRRAEEANLAKSRFLATMSHELRTPLNAILGFSEVMRDEVLGPLNNDSYKEYVKDIHSSGNHLLNLINEILDLSRIEAGRHDLKEEAVRLPYIVEDAQNMTQMKARSKGVSIICQFENNLPQIWADERAVRQIVLNLLSNALKFTPTGGTITIKVGWTSKGGQYVAIKDTGPGIPEDEIPVVLSSFGQGSIAIKSAEQGTGLGLPIVQALVHMHDGKFELKSKLREGTEVIASFPRSRILEVMPPVQNTGKGKAKPRSIAAGGLRTAS